MTPSGGFVPVRTADPAQAGQELARAGAVILTSAGLTHQTAAASTAAVLGGRLRAHRQPVNIGANPVSGQGTFFDWATRTVNADASTGGDAHTDGYMLYGNAYPDVISLLCVQAAPPGGQSAVIDGYQLLAQIKAADPDLASFLEQIPVEQSTPTGMPCRAPIAAPAPPGRLALRCHDHQRPAADDPAGREHQEKIRQWHDAVVQAAAAAPRFLLAPGDLMCMDNYRIFHLRDPYQGQSRLLLRVWAWTDQAIGLPAVQDLGQRAADIVLSDGR